MSYIYKDQSSLQIRLDTKVDLSGATSLLIKYEKPSGATGQWTATQYGATTSIFYNLSDGELNETGCWHFWSHVTFSDGRSAPGRMVAQKVYMEGTV